MIRFLTLALAASCLFVLPATCLAQTYGGFTVGQTFTFKVSERTALRNDKKISFSRKKIPKSVPLYKKGQKVKFKIGSNGRLMARGKVSIPFQNDQITQNNYNGKAGLDGAAVFKEPYVNNPIKVTLSFIRKVGKKTVRVYYTLD